MSDSKVIGFKLPITPVAIPQATLQAKPQFRIVAEWNEPYEKWVYVPKKRFLFFFWISLTLYRASVSEPELVEYSGSSRRDYMAGPNPSYYMFHTLSAAQKYVARLKAEKFAAATEAAIEAAKPKENRKSYVAHEE